MHAHCNPPTDGSRTRRSRHNKTGNRRRSQSRVRFAHQCLLPTRLPLTFADGEHPTHMIKDRIVGCILGTAVGDAIGLPYEGLSRRRASRLFGPPDRHRFVFGRGMVSDDTEHTCMVAQSLIAAHGDLPAFQRSLAWRLRLWLLGLPAGVGIATLRSIIRLWLGVSPDRSGVFSAGNGPAMRAAILGAACDDRRALRNYVRVSSRVTHADPKAEFGAFAIALAAHMASHDEVIAANAYLDLVSSSLGDDESELRSLIADAVASVNSAQTTEEFAASCGLSEGVSGYIYHSVPVAVHAWLAHPHDFRSAVMSAVRCGGDTDTIAAIVGGIVGASVGRAGIPVEWLSTLCEWPRTVSWMERLGTQLTSTMESDSQARPIRLSAVGVMLRNLFFLIIVLYHGFRRLAPPY